MNLATTRPGTVACSRWLRCAQSDSFRSLTNPLKPAVKASSQVPIPEELQRDGEARVPDRVKLPEPGAARKEPPPDCLAQQHTDDRQDHPAKVADTAREEKVEELRQDQDDEDEENDDWRHLVLVGPGAAH
jgi:hypothetical protein